MSTITFSKTLTMTECANCFIPFAIPSSLDEQLRRDHKGFYCPRGHNNYYPGESDLEKAERLRLAMKRDANDGWAAYQASQDQLRATQRSKAALKGQLTKARKKIANGVCPVGNCRRHFDNVQSHIATQHPTWHVVDPETGTDAVL